MNQTAAVLCTGASLTQDQVDAARGLLVVAVNGAYELAPWADALAANDHAWWIANPSAKDFAGRKFSANRIRDVERIKGVESHHCSGVLGLEVAKQLGARRIILLGADMLGGHFFGSYAACGLKDTSAQRREIHKAQFAKWGKINREVEVINCAPGSALECFPRATLAEVLHADVLRPQGLAASV